MILFFNLIQTTRRFNQNRLHLGRIHHIDAWKYMLSSLSVIPFWSRVVIYCEFEEYKDRQGEVEQYVHNLFKVPIEFHFRRNLYQKEWQAALEPLFDQDQLFWFFCNDDHPFIDYDLDCLTEIHEHMLHGEPSTCYLSHWPECLRAATTSKIEMKNWCFKMNRVAVEAIQIVHRDILKSWFWDRDYKDLPLPRTDSIPVVGKSIQPMYIPLRELCRHMDGYTHIVSDANACPPLEIPPGFFENNIKISSQRKPGYVHVDPTRKTHFAFDGIGADYHWVEEDIPLFWRDKIQEINIDINRDVAVVGRNESHARKATMYHKSSTTIYQDLKGTPFKDPPREWVERGFR